MEFYLVNEEKRKQVEDLWDYCFEKKDTAFFRWYFDEYCLKHNAVLGGFDKNEKLLTMVHFNPYTISLRGESLPTMYLVGVATDPVQRGEGLVQELLAMACKVLRSKGLKFVLLMPEYAGIYLRFQFAFTYFKQEYNLPLVSLFHGEPAENLHLVRLQEEEALREITVLSEVYTQSASAYNGYVQRTEEWWRGFLRVFFAEQGELVLAYTSENLPVGYLFYQHAGEVFNVQEMMTLSGRVRNNFLRYAKQHTGQQTTFRWLAPCDDVSYLSFNDQRFSGSVKPFMMARVINTKAVLETVRPREEINGSCVIFVPDLLCPENGLLAELSVKNGRVEVKETLRLPDIEVEIDALTQLYFGQFSVKQLLDRDKITVYAPQAIELLSSLWPGSVNFINEYY